MRACLYPRRWRESGRIRSEFALYGHQPSCPHRAKMREQRSPFSLSTVWILLFGLPFLLAGLFMSGLYFLGYAKYWAAKSWEEAPCWIESARLETSHHKSITYRAAATYRYRYQGRMCEGSQVTLGGGQDNIGSGTRVPLSTTPVPRRGLRRGDWGRAPDRLVRESRPHSAKAGGGPPGLRGRGEAR